MFDTLGFDTDAAALPMDDRKNCDIYIYLKLQAKK